MKRGPPPLSSKIAIALVLLAPGIGHTQAFQYSAKLLCGIQKDPDDLRLARGFYATAINIHNPGESIAVFSKKLALTFPPEGQEPGEVLRIGVDTLRMDEALKVDCIDIQRRQFPQGFPTPYIEGFVIIRSAVSLDVTAMYTTSGPDPGLEYPSSIDVEQIRERRMRPEVGSLACATPVFVACEGLTGPAGPQGDQGPPGLSGYEIVSQSVTVPASVSGQGFGTVTTIVPCPAGKVVVGGGIDTGDDERNIIAQNSYPEASGAGWTLVITNGYGTPQDVSAYAICANAG